MLKLLALSVVLRRNVPPSSKVSSNGRDLARQCQASHLLLHALGQQSRVKNAEWSRATAGPGGRTLEGRAFLGQRRGKQDLRG